MLTTVIQGEYVYALGCISFLVYGTANLSSPYPRQSPQGTPCACKTLCVCPGHGWNVRVLQPEATCARIHILSSAPHMQAGVDRHRHP